MCFNTLVRKYLMEKEFTEEVYNFCVFCVFVLGGRGRTFRHRHVSRTRIRGGMVAVTHTGFDKTISFRGGGGDWVIPGARAIEAF